MTNLSGTNLNRREAAESKGEGRESPSNFPGYREYKSSGIEWLREIPSHWDSKPLWTLFRRVKRVGYSDETLLSVYRDHGVIPKASRDDNYNKPSEDLSSYQLVEVGDLAINKMKAWQGSVAISGYRGIVSPAYHVYECHHQEDGRYLHYLFRSKEYISGYLANSKGIRVNQWDLEPQQHSRMPALLPTLDEQKTIAAFLDYETAKIDALIDEQKRLIRLLKEKREAVISHAVTKGLDPNVPMKDSGVEWLGEVPAHWGVSRLGHYASILNGYAFPSAEFSEDESDVKLLRGVNVGVSRLRWDDTAYWDLSQGDGLGKYLLGEWQIVIGMDRPWIGEGLRIARVRKSDMPCLLLQRVAAISPTDYLLGNYLFDLLSSDRFKAYIEPDMTGVSVPHISPEQVLSFVIPIPPVAEQKAISSFLEKELLKIEGLLSESEEGIQLLTERRSALISAAVTGKIDARDWQPPASSSNAEQSASEGVPA